MKAVVWKARKKLRIEKVNDPSIREPTNAIVRVTSLGRDAAARLLQTEP